MSSAQIIFQHVYKFTRQQDINNFLFFPPSSDFTIFLITAYILTTILAFTTLALLASFIWVRMI